MSMESIHADITERGLCRKSDVEFFIEGFDKGSPEYAEAKAAAKAICQVCPVKGRCLAWAIEMNEKYGVWGGKTRSERQKLRYPRRRVNGVYVYERQTA